MSFVEDALCIFLLFFFLLFFFFFFLFFSFSCFSYYYPFGSLYFNMDSATRTHSAWKKGYGVGSQRIPFLSSLFSLLSII